MATTAFTSCDSVSEPDRFVDAEIIPRRAVLMEEFTGQRCTNCPRGHEKISEMVQMFGDSIVPVSIHASNLGTNFPVGLKTVTGEEYFKSVGQPALPQAVFDMQTPPLQIADWGRVTADLIIQPTPFTVKAKCEVSGSDLNIDVAFSSAEDYEGKLMVWVCQNNIVRPQLDGAVTIQDYVHNHVFRAAVTPDIWGDDVKLEAHKAQYKSYVCPIDQYWGNENLYVVAFLYNDAGVAQVTSSHK